MSSEPAHVLQICHDDKGPFPRVCRFYAEAFGDARVTTIFLKGAGAGRESRFAAGDRVIFLERSGASLRGLKFSVLSDLISRLRGARFDLVIAHRYKPAYLAALASLFVPLPLLVVVIHDSGVFRRRTRKWFLRLFRHRLRIVAVSEAVRRDILQDCPFLEDSGGVEVIPNAIDPALEDGLMTREAARDRLGIPRKCYCYGSVGRLVSWKGQELLIEAFARVAGGNDFLVIVGSGPMENRLKARVHHLGIGDRVGFSGQVDDAFRVFPAFDAFVLTSSDREAFGVVLLEAMLAGVPVLCPDIPGPREVMADSAIRYRPGDVESLAAGLQDIAGLTMDERTGYCRRARARLDRYYDENAVRYRLRTLSLFREAGFKPLPQPPPGHG